MVLLPAVLGLNLWLLSAAVPLLLALIGHGGRGGYPAPAHLLLLCGPALLALGLLTPRHRLSALTLLLAVPLLCLLPGTLGLLGDPAHLPRAATALLGAVLLGYLAATCRWLAQPPSATQLSTHQIQRASLDAPPLPRRWRRRFAVYRGLLALSVLLPVTLLYAADFHPPLNRALLLSLGDQARQGAFQATLNAALGLLWVALFQMCFLLPLRTHLDHDRQTMGHIETLRALARRGRPRPQFYVAMLLALGSMILLVWRSLHP